MQLPELLQEIAFYVDKAALMDFMLVSKLWHQAFLPHLWKSISLDAEDSSTPKDEARTIAHIQKNAARIKTLSLMDLKADCTNQLLKLYYPLLEILH